MALGPKIRNALPEKIKKEASFIKFKEYIKLWSRPTSVKNVPKYLEIMEIHYSSEKSLDI